MRHRLVALLLGLIAAPLHSQERALEVLLVRAFCDGAPEERAAATLALRERGRRAWPLLASLVGHPDPDVRRRTRTLWEDIFGDGGDWWGRPKDGTRFDAKSGLPLEVIDKKTGIELVLVPAGTFRQGARSVSISRPFYLGRHEVTQAQFVKGFAKHYFFLSRTPVPVVDLPWPVLEGFLMATRFRLPTEAEWEHACRLGQRDAPLDDLAWHRDNSGGRRKAVGTKRPDALGLFDMLGNVAEWCADYYGPLDALDDVDPTGPARGTRRVVRGGSVFDRPEACTPDQRRGKALDCRSKFIGFRVARSP